jgi:hypothetical protein
MRLRGLFAAALAVGLGLATSAHAEVPPGWIKAGTAPADYEYAVDTTTSATGKRSASIAEKPGTKGGGFGTLMQTIAADDYRGARWRLSGYLRTDSASRAQMWMRVDGPNAKVLSFDNMDSRPVTGTTGWTRYEIVLDVPPDSADIVFGFLLAGGGKVWGDGFKFEKVDATVPVTFAGPPLPRAPVNLDFEASDTTQSAVWTPRELSNFYSRFAGGSCDRIVERLRFVLLQLGARASDLHIDARRCYAGPVQSLDASFSVLAPSDKTGKGAAGPSVEARWQMVQVGGAGELRLGVADCFYLESVTQKVLPLFSNRDAKAISLADCSRLNVGLSAQVLKPFGE